MTNAVIAAVCSDGLSNDVLSELLIKTKQHNQEARLWFLNVPKFNCDLDVSHSERCRRGRKSG